MMIHEMILWSLVGESVFLNAVLCVFFLVGGGGGMMDTNDFLNDTIMA